MDDLNRQLAKKFTLGLYILKDEQPVEEDDVLVWGAYMEEDIEKNGRRVAQTQWDKFDKPARLSTLFLGLDQNFFEGIEPILWESSFFYDEGEYTYTRVLNRYSSFEQAKAGHDELVAMIDLIEDLTSLIHPELGAGQP